MRQVLYSILVDCYDYYLTLVKLKYDTIDME
jgi:hypothetical protein